MMKDIDKHGADARCKEAYKQAAEKSKAMKESDYDDLIKNAPKKCFCKTNNEEDGLIDPKVLVNLVGKPSFHNDVKAVIESCEIQYKDPRPKKDDDYAYISSKKHGVDIQFQTIESLQSIKCHFPEGTMIVDSIFFTLSNGIEFLEFPLSIKRNTSRIEAKNTLGTPSWTCKFEDVKRDRWHYDQYWMLLEFDGEEKCIDTIIFSIPEE